MRRKDQPSLVGTHSARAGGAPEPIDAFSSREPACTWFENAESIQDDPCWRVVTRAVLAAHLSVDIGPCQAWRELRAEQEMVKPQPRVARPTVSLVIPEGVYRRLRMQRADRIRPALRDKRGEGCAALGLYQRIFVP